MSEELIEDLLTSLLGQKIEGCGIDSDEGFYIVLEDGRTVFVWMDDDGELCIGSGIDMDS